MSSDMLHSVEVFDFKHTVPRQKAGDRAVSSLFCPVLPTLTPTLQGVLAPWLHAAVLRDMDMPAGFEGEEGRGRVPDIHKTWGSFFLQQ